MEKLDYMHRNPVQRRLVTRPEDWMWSSARHYATGEGGLEIESPGQPVAVSSLARIRRSGGAMSAKSPASRKEREKGRAPAFWECGESRGHPPLTVSPTPKMSHLFRERQVPGTRHLRGGNPAHRRIFTAAREADIVIKSDRTIRSEAAARTVRGPVV